MGLSDHPTVFWSRHLVVGVGVRDNLREELIDILHIRTFSNFNESLFINVSSFFGGVSLCSPDLTGLMTQNPLTSTFFLYFWNKSKQSAHFLHVYSNCSQ